MPPTRNDGENTEAKIVSELGKEFNVDEIYGTESSYIGSLKSVNDFTPVEIPPSAPLALDQSMLKDDTTPVEDEDMAEGENAPETENDKPDAAEGEEGVVTTKQKKQKKTKKSTPMEEDESNDYDFKVDYVKKESEPKGDDGDGEDGNDGHKGGDADDGEATDQTQAA
ncbi:hypothetical protein HanOQP8_Chr01g0019201 [Helianthus annuus]|nr:hypothetical protein HanOQP8_Chr01g0019201 [Helianthus annuus]